MIDDLQYTGYHQSVWLRCISTRTSFYLEIKFAPTKILYPSHSFFPNWEPWKNFPSDLFIFWCTEIDLQWQEHVRFGVMYVLCSVTECFFFLHVVVHARNWSLQTARWMVEFVYCNRFWEHRSTNTEHIHAGGYEKYSSASAKRQYHS